MALTKVTYSMINGASSNVLDFGAVGNGVVNNYTAFNNALAASDSVIVPAGNYLIGTDLTIPSATSLIFNDGATLTIATGVTVTVTGLIDAGNFAIFTVVGTGKVVFTNAANIYAGWWSVYDTDAGIAITAAVRGLNLARGGTVRLPGRGTIITPVNMTGLQSGARSRFEIVGDSAGSNITVANNSYGFDCSGSQWLTFSNFNLTGDDVTTPLAGFFFARDVTTYNYHYSLDNLKVNGNWNKACVYSYAAEECRYNDVSFENSVPGACAFWCTGDNAGVGEGLTSPYTTILTGIQSNTANSFFGCVFKVYFANTDCMRLRLFADTYWYGCYFQPSTVPGQISRSTVYIDCTLFGSNNWVIDGFRTEHLGANSPPYNFYFDGAVATPTQYCTGVTIRNGNFTATTAGIYSSGPLILQELYVDNVLTLTPTPLSMDVSFLRDSHIQIPNAAINGDLTKDIIFADYSNFTGALGTSTFIDNVTGQSYTAIVSPNTDNTYSLGTASKRWTTVYATTPTINTSDANDKQQIADLSAAEQAVAKTIKNLFKSFKFNSAVNLKGDSARIHIGVIAQDVQTAFIAEGLDPYKYGLFCSDSWYELTTVSTDIDGNEITNVKVVDETTPNAVKVTKLGIRYEELLAFVISAI